VGDLYYVDVLGANRAGMAAVHIDRFDRYAGLPGCHIHSVLALPELLDQDPDWSEERFFPLRDWQPEAS
jgi:FMN phosphatase YigB (HAD superfamily)